MKQHVLAAIVLAGWTAMPALADHWYVGAGIGRGNFDVKGTDILLLDDASVGDNGTTYTARLGYRVTPYFALELGYYDLGKYDFSGTLGPTQVSGTVKAKSVGLSLVATLPLDAFDVYGRLGYARSELKANASGSIAGVVGNEKDKQNEATYGVGARWNVTREWGIFVEWMKNDRIQVDSYLVGADIRF